jgi:hypothetical protein
VLVRQVLGAVAEFEKTTLVAKLAAARRRKRMPTGEKVKGRKSHVETRPDVVALAKRLARKKPNGGALSCGRSRHRWPSKATSTSAAGRSIQVGRGDARGASAVANWEEPYAPREGLIQAAVIDHRVRDAEQIPLVASIPNAKPPGQPSGSMRSR